MAKPNKNTTIDYIIGMPPANATDETVRGRTNIVMENSMPIAKIYPGTPSFTEGLSLFSRLPAFGTPDGPKDLSYIKLLNSHGYGLAQPNQSNSGKEGCIVVAYQADSFPTDSFTNDYGENFLQGITNVASEGAASVTQMLGARSLEGAVSKVTGNMQKAGGIQGKIGEYLEKGKNLATTTLRNILPTTVGNGIDLVGRLAAGSRIDFPMVWKTSSFQPSYTMTVRLYNPLPGNEESTQKYIAAPIAALMLLAIPISEDGITYSWPFIHKIVSPGIYNLDPAFISNITIIKGGDQQQIGYNQKLGVVDVRIDFGSLYSSILAAKGLTRTRPTLESYLSAMVGGGSEKSGVQNFSTSPLGLTEEELQANLDQRSNIQARRLRQAETTKNQATTQEELTDEDKDNPPSRSGLTVSETEIYNRLVP